MARLHFRDLRRTFGALARAGGAPKSDTADVLGCSAANNSRLCATYTAPKFHTASPAVRGPAVQAAGAQEGMMWREAKDILRYPDWYSEEQVREAARVVTGVGKVRSPAERWFFWGSLAGIVATAAAAVIFGK